MATELDKFGLQEESASGSIKVSTLYDNSLLQLDLHNAVDNVINQHFGNNGAKMASLVREAIDKVFNQ